TRFAPLPDHPYYAVIFTAQRTEVEHGYDNMAEKMLQLAGQQPGYIGAESTRDADGLGITISYWESEESLLNWKSVSEHLLAQKLGKTRWYDFYQIRIAKVERAYSGPNGR
ncbi:MAG: antibiotic biosynthesis monooxygenase, partial [Pseudoruegeria sp.]